MMYLKIKNILKGRYYYLLKLKSKLFYGNPVLVLMYHRINNEIGTNLKGITVTPQIFEEQVIYFKNKFTVLKFNDSWKGLKKPGIILTFDDGYADNFLNALPILEKYQIPAIFFITTKNINTKHEFWWDKFDCIFESLSEWYYVPGEKDKVSKKEHSFKVMTTKIAKLTSNEKEKWFKEFEHINKIQFKERDAFRSLSEAELKRIIKHPLITVGVHTHNHFSFKELDEKEQLDELLLSTNFWKKNFSIEPKLFAFPHGSYNSKSVEVLKKLGFSHLFLANDYYSNSKQKNNGIISRIIMPNITGEKLEKRLKHFI